LNRIAGAGGVKFGKTRSGLERERPACRERGSAKKRSDSFQPDCQLSVFSRRSDAHGKRDAQRSSQMPVFIILEAVWKVRN